MNRIKELETRILKHNEAYFVHNRPIISDYEFDCLVRELQDLDPKNKVINQLHDSQVFSTFEKVTRQIPMLSLSKTYSLDELYNWVNANCFKKGTSYCMMPKIDGCAIELEYNSQGHLFRASTRGDGLSGENVTKNAFAISDIPKRIKFGPITVRGEVFMTLTTFEDFKDHAANPRNLAAGALRQKDPNKTSEHSLSFRAYDILGLEEIGRSAKFEENKFRILSDLQLPIVDYYFGISQSSESFIKYFHEVVDYLQNKLDYEIDGMVVKVGDVDLQHELGHTSHHPRYALAYKFDTDSVETTLIDVIWNMSRSGRINPVAVVEPVNVSGATVTNVSLHNLGIIEKLNPRINAKCLITRRGGVIPHIESCDSTDRMTSTINIPQTCAVCDSPLILEGDFIYCPQKTECPGARQYIFNHFAKHIGLDGFGPAIIEKLINAGKLVQLGDLYRLKEDDFLNLEKVGKVLSKKLFDVLKKSLTTTMPVFLSSLGIKDLGLETAKEYANESIDDLDNFLQKVSKLSEGDYTVQKRLRNIALDWVTRRSEILDLSKFFKFIQDKEENTSAKLSGTSFVFTGKMLRMGRNDAVKIVQNLGAECPSSIRKDLTYLVIGDGGGAGSKLTKAKKFNENGSSIEIISESKFLELVDTSGVDNDNIN